MAAPGEGQFQSSSASSLSAEQLARISAILERVKVARRELDSLIGDAYLSPRVSVVNVHFGAFAGAVEKLRWAEAEWRQLASELGLSDRTSSAASIPEG